MGHQGDLVQRLAVDADRCPEKATVAKFDSHGFYDRQCLSKDLIPGDQIEWGTPDHQKARLVVGLDPGFDA
jgi:hypothetical protein